LIERLLTNCYYKDDFTYYLERLERDPTKIDIVKHSIKIAENLERGVKSILK